MDQDVVVREREGRRAVDNAGDWSRVDALLDEVLELPEEARRDWLRRAASGDGVEREVCELLAGITRDGILDQPLPAPQFDDQDTDVLARRLESAFDGRYRIERTLGEGGMAIVFLAHEAKHDRAVVLKVLKEEAALWIGADRFRSEIQILAKLSHPHIVPLIDSGEVGGHLYYVMPWLGGETLRECLLKSEMPAETARAVLTDVARALAHAHSAGIVHRDLKPANVLCVGGHNYLMDFGIARAEGPAHGEGHTLEGVAIGTPEWMAPEQRAGRPVDARTDVYTFGLLMRAVLAHSGTDARRGHVERLANDCVQDEPSRRPANGRAVYERLLAIAARDTTRWRRAVNRASWLVAGAVAVGAATWFAWGREARLDPASLPAPVVVSPLRNETGDSTLEVWGRMAGDWLTQGLLEAGGPAVIPWPVALQAARQTADSSDAIGAFLRETRAKAVVSGAYYLSNGLVQFQAQLTDERGQVIATLPAVEVPRDSMARGVQELRDRLRGMLALRTDEQTRAFAVATRPPLFAAYEDFERGITAYNAQRYDEALHALTAAADKDTTFDAALVYLARSLWNAGRRKELDSLTTAVRARPLPMSPYLDAQMRYLEHTLAGDGAQALAAIRDAAQRAPGGRDPYNVATAAASIGQYPEAERVLRSLDPDRGALKGWAPYWYQLAHAVHQRGGYTEEWAISVEMRTRYPQSRAAWVHLVRAAAALGRTSTIDSVMRAVEAEVPDTYWSQGAMLVTAAEELEAHGFAAKAPPYYRRAESWLANQLTRNPSHEAHRYWMGSVLYDQAKWADAVPYFESLQEQYPGELRSLGPLALIRARRGDVAGAQAMLGEVPQYQRSEYAMFRARLAGAVGDTALAAGLWTEAVGHGLGVLVWQHHAARQDLRLLAAHPVAQRLGLVPPQR
jgi:tetratricopeptide (TPR) repeat protein